MKKIYVILMVLLVLTGCVGYVEADPVYPANYVEGCTTYCDDLGCREVCGRYFYSGGVTYYWDEHFGCWIGPHGYWYGGAYYHGFYPGYHEYYHRPWHNYRGGYYKSYHSGYHGGHR